MDKIKWEKITAVIDEVLKYDDAEKQNKIIHERCSNPDVRHEIKEYLQSIKKSDGFWDELIYSNNQLSKDFTKNHTPFISTSKEFFNLTSVNVPENVGPYVIKRQIARGGMGEVYLADRKDVQFHQNVALKIIRKELQTKDEAIRFEQERTILSSLNHPNIAKLLDGGISEDGRLYYVMEFVDGTPLTTYCNEHSCNRTKRLDLFKQLCSAVQYAHSNFIVHRDLKPDNLLVNHQGTIKVLDFGIAKMLREELWNNNSDLTLEGRQRLSFYYAAPEQITLSPVTTATDVYSLGLLLFELLTGQKAVQFDDCSYEKKEHIIRYEDVPAPTKISGHLKNYSDSELDAIVLKALRKQPEDRYQSAQHFLDDIIRYEHGLPVQAKQGTFTYYTKKYIKRHVFAIGSATMLIALLFSFFIFYTSNITTERELARSQALKADQATSILIGLFEANQPEFTDGNDLSVNALLQLGEERADNLEGYLDLKATMYSVIGQIYRKTGDFERANRLLSSAINIQNTLYGESHPETINTNDHYGLLLINMGEFTKAESLLQHNLDIRESRLTDNSPAIAQTLSNLGYAKRRMGKPSEAEKTYRRSLDIRMREFGNDHPLTLESLSSLAVTKHNMGQYAEAEELYRSLINIRARVLGKNHPEYAANISSLGSLLMNRSQYQKADSLLFKALQIRKKLYGNTHPDVAITVNNLAIANKERGNYSESEIYFKEALQIREKLLDGDHVNLGITKFSLADLMLKTNRTDSALVLLHNAYQIFSSQLPDNHSFVWRTRLRIGSAYLASGNNELAKQYIEDAYDRITDIHSDTSLERALADIRYGTYLYQTGQPDSAVAILELAYRILQPIEGENGMRQQEVLAILNRIR